MKRATSQEVDNTAGAAMSYLNAMPSYQVVEGIQLSRSLHDFSIASWPVIEPGTEYMDNWHLEVIQEHLEAVSGGKIKRLIINIPPRFMKSTMVGVQWPAWEWVTRPSLQYLSASHADDLATRDAYKMRLLLRSDWYQERYKHVFAMQADQDAKTRYVNTHNGQRVVTSIGSSPVGEGGNRLLVDDPHDPRKAMFSDPVRQTALDWWDNTMVTRYNNPKKDAAVIVMQRVHERDLCGHLLAKEPGVWEHLRIPMRYEERDPDSKQPIKYETCLGRYDPRTTEGELLWPERFGEPEVRSLEKSLGSYGTAAQLQQRPSPLGGGIFKRKDWQTYGALPQLEEWIMSVDCTFKDLVTSDFVAIQVWGRKGANKFLVYRLKEKMGFAATVAAVKSVKAKFKKISAVLIEDKANGSAVIETLATEIPGVLAIEPEGGKIARAYSVQPEHEAHNLFLPSEKIDPDIETFLGEASSFPGAPNDDEVDAMTQAINWYRNRDQANGVFNYYKQQAEAKAAKEKNR